MVDITSLKVRLARLRLASELDDDPRLEDPARKDLDKKRGRKKKAQLDDWEDQEVRDSEQAENESLAQEDAAEFAPKKKTKKASKDPYSEYTKNTGGKRKKNNKLTRSDQKRGKEEYHFEDYLGKKYKKKKGKKVNLSRDDSLHLQGS